MNFNTYYEKYKNIIHYLLKSYNISYDYDEFYQLLLIRMWELIERYDDKHQLPLSKYLFYRLRFYLIDLFRQRGKQEPSLTLETTTNIYASESMEEQVLTADLLMTFEPLLAPLEQQWLRLRLQGYQQAEIAKQLQRSVSSVKLYRRSVLKKYQQFMSKAEVYIMLDKNQLLYVMTQPDLERLTRCEFVSHSYLYPGSLNKVLNYLISSSRLDIKHQIATSKNLLHINKLVPIYVNQHLTLFPIRQQRAPLQIYINAHQIRGLTSKGSRTLIYFSARKQLLVDEGYTLIRKKWLESLSLATFYNQDIEL